jgi:hypothetical protein
MPTPRLTNEIIAAAIDGYESQKNQIDAKIAELRALMHGGAAEASAPAEEGSPRKRRKMSAAGRKAIAEAQRKRWAAVKGTSGKAASAAPKKRHLSEAGRKAIIAATKKRWALKRAAEAAKG